MTEPAVLFVKPGAIKPNDKGRLYKAGVIVVEVEDPAAVNFVRPSSSLPFEEVPPGDILAAFAAAVNRASGYTKTYLAEELSNMIMARHEAKKS